MTFVDVLILLIVGGVIGSIGQAIVGFSRGGCMVSIALGFIGALLGTWLARLLELPDLFVLEIGSTRLPVVWSIIGCAIFVGILSAFSKSKRR